ncbi:MAG: Crp/Fnr family transcriptional regulator [Bacteroidetes bacterium]|nr:Crp/Fnr family transcriptional regulator [Bacteroidota bacterium]MBS1975173.1 Crp/Fnr family transcriptional regulator [Bacteroidota bacterium]
MDPVDIIAKLRKDLSVYVIFTDEEAAYISQFLEIRNFEKKTQFVKIGEIETYLNYISKGMVRKFFLRGREQVITQIAKENDAIMSTIGKARPSTYILETIEPTVLVSIKKQKLKELFKDSHKVEHLGRMIATAMYLQKENWEYDRMRLNTRERFVQFIQNNPDLLQRVPQKYLASYLNIKPETFSRMKHLLKKRR